eukprot:Nk52_evm44s1444 gene=Nk52_evmTU44s1444
MDADRIFEDSMHSQLERLLLQMADLKEALEEGDITQEEYEESKQDTLEQLELFQNNINALLEDGQGAKGAQGGEADRRGSQDGLARTRLATRAVIGEKFRTHQVLKMFAGKETEQLRVRFQSIQEQHRLDRDRAAPEKQQKYIAGGLEIIIALRALGESLNEDEEAFVQKYAANDLTDMEEL